MAEQPFFAEGLVCSRSRRITVHKAKGLSTIQPARKEQAPFVTAPSRGIEKPIRMDRSSMAPPRSLSRGSRPLVTEVNLGNALP